MKKINTSFFKTLIIKSTLICLLVLGIFGQLGTLLYAVDCNTSDITLTTQTEVNTFQATYGPCDRVAGQLRIDDDNDSNDNITDLTPLAGLTSIGGSLILAENNSLVSLNGLNNITSTGTLEFAENTALTDVNLLSLTVVNGHFRVKENPLLPNLDGFSNLTNIQKDMDISENNALVNIDGLSFLQSVGGLVRLEQNPLLQNLNGLCQLNSVNEDLTVNNNAQLTDCCGVYPIINAGGIGQNINMSGNNVAGNCNNNGNDLNGTDCASEFCIPIPPTPIPTLSQWGLIILALLLMICGTLYLMQPNFAEEENKFNRKYKTKS